VSQFPPPPPSQGYPPPPPPGQNYPPGGYPPQGQSYGYPPQPQASNGLSITSLIMGILLCIPAVTGIGAIAFGIAGIRKARDPRYGGRGMAISGIVLGFVNLIGWAMIGGLGYYGYQQSKPVRQLANSFLTDLSNGDVNAASRHCHSTMAIADLQRVVGQMQPWGKFKDATFTQYNMHSGTAGPRFELGGVAQFDKATKTVKIVMTQEAGQWKIVEFNFPP
jgi:amino acid transporter